jgi:hypothetical protein
MKTIKTFEEHKIVNKSDLVDSGNWSAVYHIKKGKNENPYIKKDGELVKVDSIKSIPKNAIYISDEKAKEYNKITKEIKKLEELRNKIIK